MKEKLNFLKLSQIGEFALIERLAKHLPKKSSRVVVGIGDDAAAIRLAGKYLLITTDTLIENIHFKLKERSFFDLGYKALAVNISDIAAMGGYPTYALITIGLPKNLAVNNVDELYRGLNHLAKKYKIEIIGGDTVQSPREVVISITLLGEVGKDYLLTRSGAKIGDAILVSGDFGGPAAAAYRLPLTAFGLRLSEARIIAQSQLATSMIDSSDGLVRSVTEICKLSKAGARIWQDSIPIAAGATLEQALYGGEEYELVFTVPKEKALALSDLLTLKTKTKVSIVGQIVDKKRGLKLVDLHGKVLPLQSKGYEHFK